MRILVCGGRDFTDKDFVYWKLGCLWKRLGFDVLIEGDAPGVDRIAGYWARVQKITNIRYPANWKKYGKAAGPIRNKQMLDEGKPDMVIAFPGGRGTENMIKQAQEADIEVIRIKYEPQS